MLLLELCKQVRKMPKWQIISIITNKLHSRILQPSFAECEQVRCVQVRTALLLLSGSYGDLMCPDASLINGTHNIKRIALWRNVTVKVNEARNIPQTAQFC